MTKTLLATTLALCFALPCAADDGKTANADVKTFVAKGDINLRSSPPSGLFYTMGDKIGLVKTGDTVIQSGADKTVKTLFGRYLWKQVTVVDKDSGARKGDGWVYVGKSDGESYLEPARLEKSTKPPEGGKP